MEPAPKDKLKEDIEQEIDAFVNAYEFEPDPFQDLKSKRARLKLQIQKTLEMQELSTQLEKAFEILFSEGSKYLENEANEKLLSDLSNSAEKLKDIGVQEAGNSDLQSLIKISDTSIISISEVAFAKFEEKRYADALALFSFLSILDPGSSEFWFRLGIAAQKNGNVGLASRAYAATLAIDPNNFGARLFAAECLAELNRFEEAKAEVAAAKDIVKNIDVEQMWLDLISAIESVMNKEDKA
jgi:hypothetical protein